MINNNKIKVNIYCHNCNKSWEEEVDKNVRMIDLGCDECKYYEFLEVSSNKELNHLMDHT